MRRRDTPRILIPDTRHFGRRHFRPLHDLAADGQIRLWTERSRRSWWRRGGDYRRLAGRLARHLRELEAMPPAELPAHRHRGVPVLACARGELLRLLLPRWGGDAGPNRDPEMLERILACDRDREDLLLCMAAARDWVDFWLDVLARKGPFSHAVVHSGATIYARTLQEVGARQGLRLFAVERFAVGELYYFEERATPLPNRSLLADPEWRRRLTLPGGDRAARRGPRRSLPPPRSDPAPAGRVGNHDAAAVSSPRRRRRAGPRSGGRRFPPDRDAAAGALGSGRLSPPDRRHPRAHRPVGGLQRRPAICSISGATGCPRRGGSGCG